MPETFTDHLGRRVRVPSPPQRIISLCPSQTATLFALGLGGKVVGRTRFCIHPQPEITTVERVGGTKAIKYERISRLAPDLIIGEKEENTPEMVAQLEREYPVYITDVRDLGSAEQMVRDLGRITGQPAAGAALAEAIQDGMASIRPLAPRPHCVYLIWRKPWMAAGADTFIDAVLQHCGFDNLARAWEGRYPEFRLDDLRQWAPRTVFLSSEPFPFAQKHREEIRAVLPEAEVRLVDGEMFSWYGSHMQAAPDYLNALLENFR
ncbi:MAG: helical backbone metal receptor [Bacteroidota bacterium]